MPMVASFFRGFFGEMNQIAKEKADAKAKQALADREFEDKMGMELVKSFLKGDITKPEGLPKRFEPYLTGISNKMSTIENSFGYGSLMFDKPNKKWDEDLRPDNPLRAGGTWLNTWNTILSDPKNAAKAEKFFNENPNYRDKFVNDVQKYSDYYITGQRYKEGRTDVVHDYIPADEAYKPLFGFLNKTKIMPDGDRQVQGTADQKLIQNETSAGKVSNPANAFVFSFRTSDGKKQDATMEFKDSDLEALQRVSANLGYGGDVQGFIKNFQDVGRADTVEEAYGTLLSAVEMERMGFGQLAAGTLTGSQQLQTQFANYVKDEFGGDYRAAIQAYAPLVKIKEDQATMTGGYLKRETKMAPPEDYFTRNKLNKEQVINQYEASEQTVRQLEQLSGLLSDSETSSGLKAKIQNLGFGVFGEGGQLSQFFGDETNRGGFEDGTTVESLTQRAIASGFLSPTAAEKLSQMDALKLSLAAQMARAVDPSGRLSNQDFEIQLQRLGQVGWFTSKTQAQASLNVVIDDFKRQRRRLEILHEVAIAPEFGRREARILRADQIIRQAQAANYKATSAAAPAAADAGAVTPKPAGTLTLDQGLGLYTDGTSFYRDEAGTQPVPAAEVMQMMSGAKS